MGKKPAKRSFKHRNTSEIPRDNMNPTSAEPICINFTKSLLWGVHRKLHKWENGCPFNSEYQWAVRGRKHFNL